MYWMYVLHCSLLVGGSVGIPMWFTNDVQTRIQIQILVVMDKSDKNLETLEIQFDGGSGSGFGGRFFGQPI